MATASGRAMPIVGLAFVFTNAYKAIRLREIVPLQLEVLSLNAMD
jgi:hypothetical protein